METQLEREIDVMSRMDHPGLIKLHEVMTSPRNKFLVLDLAAGGELFNKLAESGPLAEAAARSYFQQLIDALDYMHSMNAIHRDLKPENLLLDASDRLKIADFGLSVFSGGGMLKTRCGTPNYLAPEVFHSDGYAGPSVDIWSAGVILYVMLAAELPFDAPSITELGRKIMAVQITYPKSIPGGAVDLIRSILIADPEHRPTIDQIRQHPWFAVNYSRTFARKESGAEGFVQSKVGEAAKAPGGSAIDEDDGMDAFELIAAIGSLNMQRLVDQKAPVSTTTSFSCSKSKADVIQELIVILGNAGVPKGQLNPSKTGSFKVEVPHAKAKVALKIEVRTITDQTTLVEVRRGKGAMQLDFVTVYRNIRKELT